MAEEDARKGIERTNRGFMEAAREGDAGELAMLYGKDAVVLPPGFGEARGMVDIRTFWQGAFDAGVKEIQLDTREVESFGDTAYEVGRFTLKGAGGQTIDAGKYLVVWKREAGAWRLHRDIWNSSGGK